MKFKISDLFKSRRTKVQQAPKPVPQETPIKPKEPENLIPKKERPVTRRSVYSHSYRGSSTKNNYMLNLKYKASRRKKNRQARRQRVTNKTW